MPSADTNQSRWVVSEVWQVVQQASISKAEATPAVRAKKIERDAEHTLAGFVGYGTSLAARTVVLHDLADQAAKKGLKLPLVAGLPRQAVQEDGGGFLAW